MKDLFKESRQWKLLSKGSTLCVGGHSLLFITLSFTEKYFCPVNTWTRWCDITFSHSSTKTKTKTVKFLLSQHRMAPSHLLPQMFPMLHLVSSEILCNWFFSNLNYQLYTQFAVFDSGASLPGFVLSLIFAIGGNIIARQANVARGDGKPTLARIQLQDSASTNPQCQPSSDQNRNGGFDLSNQEIQFCKERRKHESQPQKTSLLENLETWHQNKWVYQVIALHCHKQYKENIFQGMVWSQRCRNARRRQTFARILESKTQDVQQKGAVTILSKKGKTLKSSL